MIPLKRTQVPRMADERTTPEEARRQLARMGIPAAALSDEQAIRFLGQILRAKLPPAIPASTPPISGRAWLSAALTAGGFVQPEDRKQTADLGDGGLKPLTVRSLTGEDRHAAVWFELGGGGL